MSSIVPIGPPMGHPIPTRMGTIGDIETGWLCATRFGVCADPRNADHGLGRGTRTRTLGRGARTRTSELGPRSSDLGARTPDSDAELGLGRGARIFGRSWRQKNSRANSVARAALDGCSTWYADGSGSTGSTYSADAYRPVVRFRRVVVFARRHLWTPPVSPLGGCGFAPLASRRTSRFFVAKASPGHDRSLWVFTLGHSPHLSAGGARFATGSDAPCRLIGADRSFHFRPARFDMLRRTCRRDDRLGQDRSHEGLLQPPCSRSRTPSTSSIRTFRCEVGSRSSTLCQLSRAPGTPFRLSLLPACHGDGPLREVTRLRAVAA